MSAETPGQGKIEAIYNDLGEEAEEPEASA
jgi:hypothetical protein